LRHTAWAVGGSTNGALILHWNSTAWSQVPVPASAASGYLTSVSAESATDAWAVGFWTPSAAEDTLILRWSGTAWSHWKG
jgi:hypothetical protein